MDLISNLPNALISQILSFLPTKQAASTSVLSKRWRFLFASVTNLEFVDGEGSDSDEEAEGFVKFVDRVMAVQGNRTINRFSLNCIGYPDLVHVTAWIHNVLARGVSDFELSVSEYELPPKIFVSKTLVKLKLGEANDLCFGADVVEVCLPKLKSLHLDSVLFEEEGVGLAKLLSGCPVLEELILNSIGWGHWGFCSVSNATIKRLTSFSEDEYDNPKSMSFDTPNLVYLEYSDNIAGKYPNVNFESLVEAYIGFRLSEDQSGEANFSEDEYGYFSEGEGDQEKEMVGNVTDFLMGIRNVKILYLSANALEVLTFCCEVPPVFNNLIQLTIESNREIGWDSLPGLLKNCPNLETLVFKGLVHKSKKDVCGNMCCCRTPKNPSYLSSSTVKVLKIIMTMDKDDDDEGMETEQIKHFLEKMPCLEQLIVYYDMSFDPSVFDLSKKLHDISRNASPKCNIQVISPNLNLSATIPSSLSEERSAPPNEESAWFLNALV